MPPDAISNETIQAIASLWKLVAAIAFLLVVIFLKEPLQQAVMKIRNFRFKKGESELSMETGPEEVERETSPAKEKKQEPPELIPTEEPTLTEDMPPPKPSDLLFEMWESFDGGKFEDAEQAFERLQKAESDSVSRGRNQALYYWLMYKNGRDTNAIQKLEDLAKQEEGGAQTLYWVAICHEHSRSYTKAIDAYRRALTGNISTADRLRYTVGLAKCYVAMGNIEKGLKVLTTALTQVTGPEESAELYRTIAGIYEKRGNSTLRAITLQKLLESVPEDTVALFSASYAQSEANLSCLCVVNYSTLLGFNPAHNSGLNNLGVECDALGLPIKSISYYKRASEYGETLAMSNLAYHYMRQGFELEAQELLDKARKEDAPHRNVGQAMSALADKKAEENKAWDKIITEGMKQKEFFWAYADAYFLPSDQEQPFVGRWSSPTGKVFIISQENDVLTAQWETEHEGEKFEGTVHNLAVEIKYQRKKGLGLSLSTSGWSAAKEGFAYLSQDGSRIHIHTSEKQTTFFLELNRLEVDTAEPGGN